MRAVVTGMIATFPVGGVFWDYGQYAVGLERLGWDVWYLEDGNMPCLDLATGDFDWSGDWTSHARYLQGVLASVSPTLGQRWHLRSDDGQSFGVDRDEMIGVIAEADLFLNLSGATALRDEYLPSRCKVLLDTDPGWNHYMRWPLADRSPAAGDHGWRAHDRFATYAERLGRPDCPLPDHGLEWHPTRPPVVLDSWGGAPRPEPGSAWTTVLTWSAAPLPITDGTVSYGTKEQELPRIEHLPQMVNTPLELAVGGSSPPVERWREQGWSVVEAAGPSATPHTYRDYIVSSRGELSVAKNVYVETRSGWFSCRSVCYLAAGRPVVVQDTGWSDLVPTGDGLFAFDDADSAAAALETVEGDWDHHSAAAAEVAQRHFDSDVVLADLLDRVAS